MVIQTGIIFQRIQNLGNENNVLKFPVRQKKKEWSDSGVATTEVS